MWLKTTVFMVGGLCVP
jgi:hypothetical protein